MDTIFYTNVWCNGVASQHCFLMGFYDCGKSCMETWSPPARFSNRHVSLVEQKQKTAEMLFFVFAPPTGQVQNCGLEENGM